MKKVYLVGIGMGNPDTLTLGAQRAVEESQLVIGARRLVDAFPQFEGERLIMIKSSDIAQAIHENTASTISVLLSGDQGFYSGAAGLYDLLADCDVEALPGISSPVYFCAKLKKPWQNAPCKATPLRLRLRAAMRKFTRFAKNSASADWVTCAFTRASV